MADPENGLNTSAAGGEAPGVGDAVRIQVSTPVQKRFPLINVATDTYSLIGPNTLYIDKTLILKDILDGCEGQNVLFFLRPRRFGKTMMMTMLKAFFEKPGTASNLPASRDTSLLFQNRKIWACGEAYQAEQGKYPVIYLTFKDAKEDSWEELYNNIFDILKEEAGRHPELRDSPRCNIPDIAYYRDLTEGTLPPERAHKALNILAKMLAMHYGVQTVIIIDEYDTPLQESFIHGYYDKAKSFYGKLLSGGLKGNEYVKYGFVTGILRAAKAGIFSGLNNPDVFTVLDEDFSTYFGFTEEEVREIAQLYGKEDKFQEICEWYDGYCFGGTRIFNPWSVLNYFRRRCNANLYWVETSENVMLDQLFENADYDTIMDLTRMQNWEPGRESKRETLNLSVIYPEMGTAKGDLFSFLLMTGYLKAENIEKDPDGLPLCDLLVPNKEVRSLLKSQIIRKFTKQDLNVVGAQLKKLQYALQQREDEEAEEILREFLLQTVSTVDLSSENSYHMLLAGLLGGLSGDRYYITSNREAGSGRYDIQMEPLRKSDPGIILELKVLKSKAKRFTVIQKMAMKNQAMKAIQQCHDKHYDTELRKRGVSPILVYGVTFWKKEVVVILDST